jgi:small membrane protein
MNTFQVVFITFCAVQGMLALRRYVKTRQVAPLAFLTAWSGAVVLIANPEVTTRIAQSVGIGRGVDFVTYSLLVAFLWAHYQHYLRYKRVENEVTLLVRELAIAHAARPADDDRGAGLRKAIA